MRLGRRMIATTADQQHTIVTMKDVPAMEAAKVVVMVMIIVIEAMVVELVIISGVRDEDFKKQQIGNKDLLEKTF